MNHKNLHVKISVILILLILILLVLISNFIPSVSKHLHSWNISITLPNFILKEYKKESHNNIIQEKLEASKKNTTIRIIKTVSENSSKYISDKKYLLHSLFEPTTSPYPEVISNTIECPEEFKPKIVKTEFGEIYYLYAGERYNFGVCTKDLVAFSAAYGIFNCKDKGIFEVQIFSKSQQEIEQIIQTFQCNL